MNTFADLLAHFPDAVQQTADRWVATCPACLNRKKLNITEGKVKAFLKCWKECDETAVMAAAGLADTRLASREEAPARPRQASPYTPALPMRTLSARHRAELHSSSISDDVITAMGVYTENDPAALRDLGYSAGQARCVPCLVFPCHTPDGRTLYQIKPDKPFRNEDGKPVKYMTPAGGGYGIGVLPHRRPALVDITLPLWITEGTKKQGCAETHGLLCLSVAGVWMWQRKNEQGEHVPLPDWEVISLDGRTVYVAFDSDAMRKSDVHHAMQELTGFLATRGAVVKIVYLPDEDDGAKTGIDDYLAASHTVEDLLSLADEVLRPIPPDFAQETVKALQKRLRDKPATFSATDITFSTLDTPTVKAVGYALRGIETEMHAVTFWGWAACYLAAKEVIKPGYLEITFSKWFGEKRLRYAQNAASIAKKFPADKFNRLIPPWVFQEIATADAETQQLILDICEIYGMTFKEVRATVRQSKGLDPYPEAQPRAEPIQEGILPLLRRLKEQVPQEELAELVLYFETYGTAEVMDVVRHRKNQEHLSAKVHGTVNSSISFLNISAEDLQCLPCGKYKGYALSDIEDDGYLNWMLEEVSTALRPIIEQEIQRRVQSQLEDHAATTAAPDPPKFTVSNIDSFESSPETEAAESGDAPIITPADIPLRLETVEPLTEDTSPPDQPVGVVRVSERAGTGESDAPLVEPPLPLCLECHERPRIPGDTRYCAECRDIEFERLSHRKEAPDERF
jgi:hypothetical protein